MLVGVSPTKKEPRLAMVGALLLIAGCSGPPAPTTPPSQTNTSEHSPFDTPPDLELDAVEKAGCQAYGITAGGIAQDRVNGIPLEAEIQAIREHTRKAPAVTAEFSGLAEKLYTDPLLGQLSPEGAVSGLELDCIIRVQKHKGGAQTFSDAPGIQHALADFKTFDGTPLYQLLSSYGIRFDTVELVPARVFPNPDNKPGDLVITITYLHGPTKKMPCRLRAWFKQPMPITELIRHGDTFPLVRPDDDDPVIFWAATGKCSDAYSF